MKNLCAMLFLLICFSCEKEKDPIVISSFEPTSGDYNTEVIIKGSQFNPSSQVLFGKESARTVSASSTEIVTIVPVGAVTGKITVKSGGQQSVSENDFTVTSGAWIKKTNFTNIPVNNLYDLFFSIGNKGYVHASAKVVNGIKMDAELWEYNQSSNSWAKKKELSLNQGGSMALAFGTATKGYILQYQALWEYDPANDQWTKKNALPVALNTDKMIGGFYVNSENIVIVILNNQEWFTYNPVSDTWGRNMNAPFASASSSYGNSLSQGGQSKGFFKIGKEVWEYDPVNNQWAKLPDFPSSLAGNYTFGISDELYIGSSEENDLWAYKPSLKKWVQKAGFTTTFRYGGLYFTLGDKGYLGMGSKVPGNYVLYDFNEFNP